jgi:predicted RNA binding protein YcfA (HicA-like mRNA interferase family)
MTILKIKDIMGGLCKKGFIAQQKGHTFLTFYVGGKKTSIYTMVSHGGKEIGDGLIGTMASQVRLDKNQFIDLVNCPLERERYIEELVKNGDLQI